MFTIEKLKKVNHIISHADCPDGIGSAIILKDVLPDAKLTYLNYDYENYEKFPAKEGMLFCDFVPPKARIKEFFDKEIIILDHHETNKSLLKDYKYGVFADKDYRPGIAGTNLAFENVWQPLNENSKYLKNSAKGINSSDWVWKYRKKYEEQVESFQRNIGIRDTWENKSIFWKDSIIYSQVLKFFPNEYWNNHNPVLSEKELEIGEILYSKLLESIETNKNNFKEIKINGFKIYFCSLRISGFTDLAEYFLDSGAHLVVGSDLNIRNKHDYLSVSLRAKQIDCTKIAETFGGGGHKNAGGFRLPVKKGVDPFSSLMYSIKNYFLNKTKK